MNWATLISELRSNTGTTASNYSDPLALIDLNKSYHYIEDCLTQEIGENYFYQEFTSDATVAGQKEYTFPANITGNLDGTNKVLSISIDCEVFALSDHRITSISPGSNSAKIKTLNDFTVH